MSQTALMPQHSLTPYLFYAGRCDEAIEFYKHALGAHVEMIMRFNESPHPQPPGVLQAGFEAKVMHASISFHGLRIMMSDGCDDKIKIDGIRLALGLPTEADVRKAFDALVEGGKVEMPPTQTFWSPCYGMLTDKFGLPWMISVFS
jgi:PhnB protein